jgi:ankyrin repeat protein
VLLQLGVDKDAKTVNGATPLHYAADNGHVEAMQLLVQLGVDKDAKGPKGFTPLQWAAGNGHVEVMRVLRSRDGRRQGREG